MLKSLLVFISLATSYSVQPAAQASEVDFDLSTHCGNEENCGLIQEITHVRQGRPIRLNTKDGDGNPWSIIFRFGFSNISYHPTDLHLSTRDTHVVIKHFQFTGRTSAASYDPQTWKQWMDYFRWIDEPSNTFELNIEKKNNVITVVVTHPKFFTDGQQTLQVNGILNGQHVAGPMPINTPNDVVSTHESPSMHIHNIQNTYGQIDYQIGYGRKLMLLNYGRAGSLSYMPHVEFGVTQGSTEMDIGDKSYNTGLKLQGYNASIGHTLQYDLGRLNVFVDQRYNYAHITSVFPGAVLKYNLTYTPVTVGVGYKIWKQKGRNRTWDCPKF